jgi:hypothetical protein
MMPSIKEIAAANFPTAAPADTAQQIAPTPFLAPQELMKKGISFGEQLFPAMARTGVGAGEELQRILAGIIPGAKPGPLVTPITPAAKMLGAIPAYELGAEALGPLAALRGVRAIPGVLRRALGGAAFGAAVQPQQRGVGALMGAGLSPVADLATSAAAPLESLKGLTKFLRPRRSEESIKAIQKAMPQGVSLPAGTLMQSSPLMATENLLEKIPFSGMQRGAQDLHLNIKTTLNDFMGKLHGKDNPDLNKAVFDEMHQGYENAHKRYDASLDEFFKNAKGDPEAQALTSAAGLHIPSTRLIHDAYTKAAQKVFRRTEGMKKPPADMEALKDALHDYHPDKIQPSLNSLRDFETEKKLINLNRRENYGQKHHVTAKFLGDIRRSLMMDLDENAENIAPGLADKLKASDRIYRDEVMPYKKVGKKNTPFYNVLETAQKTGKDLDSDKFIQNYLKPGSGTDQANLLSEVINKSANPEKTRQLLTNYHFRSAKGAEEVHPGNFMSQYNKLGDRQKGLLFGRMKKTIDDFNTIKTHYPDAFNPDFMPKTGARMAKLAIPAAEGLAAGGALLHGGLIPTLGILGATTLGARGLSKLLQSDILPELMKSGAAQAAISPAVRGAIRPTLLSSLLTRKSRKREQKR